jgi:hypothetical protein
MKMEIGDVSMDDGLKHLHGITSLNNKFIVEMYKKEALRSKEINGFSFVDQKLTIKGLKTLVSAQLNDGTIVRKDSLVFIKEEVLHTAAWAQKAYSCDSIEGQFLIVDLGHVEFIEPVSDPLQCEPNGSGYRGPGKP